MSTIRPYVTVPATVYGKLVRLLGELLMPTVTPITSHHGLPIVKQWTIQSVDWVLLGQRDMGDAQPHGIEVAFS
jgi:hypothetical protein